MKKIIFSLLIVVLIFAGRSQACVGKVITIGALDSPDESLLAELVSVLIIERTGTTVNIKIYHNSKEIYDALKKDEIGMVIENTERALKLLNISGNMDRAKAYEVSKEEFRNRLNLIWLKSFGTINREDGPGQYYYAPVITEYVMVNFPAIPRLLGKLSDITADRSYQALSRSVRSGERARKAVKEFLKKKRLV